MNKLYTLIDIFTGLTSAKEDSHQAVKPHMIEIPIIQRDYAQGRKTEKVSEVRTEFLKSLHTYLEDDAKAHELDFIYGTSKDALDNMRKFIPLDGQQRLTTLFLLHWYLGQRSPQSKESRNLKNIFSKGSADLVESMFVYRTRESATEFCNELVQLMKQPLDFSNLAKVKKDDKIIDSIEATIKNLSSYSPTWNNDPTVQSMLVMLDDIHKEFCDAPHQEFLARLLNKDNPAIVFSFMDLDDYNLTDDLYIKMNSRGKPLTSFENFKAKFEQYIETQKDDKIFETKIKDIKQLFDEKKSPISSLKAYFSHNIDTKWTNLFWGYCQREIADVDVTLREKALEDKLDKKIANFIRVIFTNAYAIVNKRGLNQHILIDSTKEEISFAMYSRENALSAYGVNLLIDALDVLSTDADGNELKKVEILLPADCAFFDEQKIVEKALVGKVPEEYETESSVDKFGFVDRVRLHAYLVYLIAFGKKNKKDLLDWMHFVYNVTANSNREVHLVAANIHLTLISLNNLIKRMKGGNGQQSISNIFEFLRKLKPSEDLGFEYTIQKEEIIKAHLRSRGIYWKCTIDKFEDYGVDSYFTGQIGFLFDMIEGLEAYIEEHCNANWDAYTNDDSFHSFYKYGRLAKELFRGGFENRVYASDSLFERVMICLHPEYIKASLLSSTSRSYNNPRDYSWKRRLHSNNENRVTEALCDLFNQLSIGLRDNLEIKLRVELKKIITNNQPKIKWLNKLANSSELIQVSTHGFIDTYDDGSHILHGKRRYSWSDYELFTYNLYISYKDTDDKIKGVGVWYKTANPGSERPGIAAEFEYKAKLFSLKIIHEPIDNDFGYYCLAIDMVSGGALLNSQNLPQGFVQSQRENESNVWLLPLPNKTDDEVIDKFIEIYSDLCQK